MSRFSHAVAAQRRCIMHISMAFAMTHRRRSQLHGCWDVPQHQLRRQAPRGEQAGRRRGCQRHDMVRMFQHHKGRLQGVGMVEAGVETADRCYAVCSVRTHDQRALLRCTSPGEFAFHKRTAWSADADASTSLPINATSLTQSVCPSKVASGLSSAPPTLHL